MHEDFTLPIQPTPSRPASGDFRDEDTGIGRLESTSVYYRSGRSTSLGIGVHSGVTETIALPASSCVLERSKSRTRLGRSVSRRKCSCSGTRCGTSRAGHTSCLAQGTQASACKVMMKLALSTPHHALKNLAKGPLTRPNNFMMIPQMSRFGIRKVSIRTNARS